MRIHNGEVGSRPSFSFFFLLFPSFSFFFLIFFKTSLYTILTIVGIMYNLKFCKICKKSAVLFLLARQGFHPGKAKQSRRMKGATAAEVLDGTSLCVAQEVRPRTSMALKFGVRD